MAGTRTHRQPAWAFASIAMSRADRVAVAGLVLMAPALAFPRAFGLEYTWLSALLGTVALAIAVGLVRDSGRLAVATGALGFAALLGWARAAGQVETIDHFAGLALGLLAMGTMAFVCRTHRRLAYAVCLVVLLGAATLGVGVRSVTPIPMGKALALNPLAGTEKPPTLPFSALHARREENPNALGAAAMLILPVAAMAALTPAPWLRWHLLLRLLGWLTALGAGVVVLLTQSRSVWLSAVVVLVLLLRRWLRPRSWWLAVGTVAAGLCVVLVTVANDTPVATGLGGALEGRTTVWEDGLRALRTSPWLGIGFDYLRHSGLVLQQDAPDRIVGAPHAHNIFLQTALDLGLFGLACYLAFVGLVLRRAIELAAGRDTDVWVRSVGGSAALSLVSVHVFGIFDAVPLGAKVGLFQWLACGLILAAWRLRTSAGPEGRLL